MDKTKQIFALNIIYLLLFVLCYTNDIYLLYCYSFFGFVYFLLFGYFVDEKEKGNQLLLIGSSVLLALLVYYILSFTKISCEFDVLKLLFTHMFAFLIHLLFQFLISKFDRNKKTKITVFDVILIIIIQYLILFFEKIF